MITGESRATCSVFHRTASTRLSRSSLGKIVSSVVEKCKSISIHVSKERAKVQRMYYVNSGSAEEEREQNTATLD